MTSSFFLNFPHLWRVVAPTSFCIAPLAYLYVRSVLEQSYRFRKTDWLYFMPAILYAFSLLPFYVLPENEKITKIARILSDKRLIFQEPEGTIPLGWGVISRMIMSLLFAFAQIRLLIKWKKPILDNTKNDRINVEKFRWLSQFTLILTVFYLLLFIQFVVHLTTTFNFTYVVITTLSSTIFFISITLLTKPHILYGMTGWLQHAKEEKANITPTFSITEELKQQESKKTFLTPELGLEYKAALENHFNTNHPFSKGGYSIRDLSLELNIPVYQLSMFINQQYEKNFNELINDFRVDYLTEMFNTSPDFFQFTLEAIGKKAGFNSRTAFIAAVKKKTGKTPSEYFSQKKEALSA
jgi:AraC-like DNA-binding protein